MPKLPTLDLQPLTPPSESGGLDLQPYNPEPEPPDDYSFGSGYGLPSLQDIYSTALKMPGRLISTGVGALDLAQAPWRSMAPGVPAISSILRDNFGYDPKGWEQEISENEDSPELKAAQQEHARASGISGTASSYWRNPGLAALDIEASAPEMILGGAIGRGLKYAKPALSAITASGLGEFATTASSQAAQIQQANDDFRPQDATTALASGALTALISGAGGKLAKGVGLPDVDAFLADRNITGSRRIPALFQAGLIEGVLEEAPQSYQEQVATNLATGKPWNEGATGAAVSGAISGFGMGSTMPAFRRGAPSVPPVDDTFSGSGRSAEVEGFEGDEEAVGTSFTVPEAQVTDTFIKHMRENGFVRAGMLPGGMTLFKSVNELDTPSPEVTPDAAFSPPTPDLPLNEPTTPLVWPPPGMESQGAREGETTGRVASMPVSTDQSLNTILNGPRDEASVDAAANDFVLRISKITNPQELTRILQSIQLQPQTAVTRGLIDVVARRLEQIQPNVDYTPTPTAQDSVDAGTYTEEDRARMAENLRRMLPADQMREQALDEELNSFTPPDDLNVLVPQNELTPEIQRDLELKGYMRSGYTRDGKIRFTRLLSVPDQQDSGVSEMSRPDDPSDNYTRLNTDVPGKSMDTAIDEAANHVFANRKDANGEPEYDFYLTPEGVVSPQKRSITGGAAQIPYTNQNGENVSIPLIPRAPSVPLDNNVTPFPEQPSADLRDFHKDLMGQVQSRGAELQQRAVELRQTYPHATGEQIHNVISIQNNINRARTKGRDASVQEDLLARVVAALQQQEATAPKSGPTGIVPRTESGVENIRQQAVSDRFSDEEARALIDRAMPQPGPERQPATEFGQDPIDQQIAEWERSQDDIIRGNQEANGPLMGPTVANNAMNSLPERTTYSIDPDEMHEVNNLNPRIKVTQDENGTHLFIDGKEFNVWNGGPTATEVKNVEALLADPESHQRFFELRDANGTGYLVPQWKRDLVNAELNPPSVPINPPAETGLQRVGEQVRTGEILAADPTQYGPKGEGFLRRTLKANPNLSPADISQMHEFLVSLDAPNTSGLEKDEWGHITPTKPDGDSGVSSMAKPPISTRAQARTELMEMLRQKRIDTINENISAERHPMEGVAQIEELMRMLIDEPAWKTGWDKLSHEGKRLAAEVMHMVRPGEGISSMHDPLRQQADKSSAIIEAFSKKLPLSKADNWSDVDFILPDGTKLTHGGVSHISGAEAAGYDLEDAMKAGIIRVAREDAGVEIHAPITKEQAEVLSDLSIYRGVRTNVDVMPPNAEPRYRTFTKGTGARHIREWVNNTVSSRDEDHNFLTEMTGKTPDDFIRMEVGKRADLLRNMQGSYAEHGARVANKELLQNAIDATPTGGKIDVVIDFKGLGGKGPFIMVNDEGPGLPIDMIKNEFVTLTGSGKRGQVSQTGRKSIGEMGVGKATYLLGTDSFEVTTVAKEPDGSTWKYDFKGNADIMIGEDLDGNPIPPMKINKTRMPDNTPTGTSIRIFDKDTKNLEAAREYLKIFADYSDTPVTVNIETNQYDKITSPYMHNAYDINKAVTPRTTVNGQHVHSDSINGGDYSIHVPTDANWSDKTQQISVILNARGMFQGVESVWVGQSGAKLPDRVVLNIEPTVSAQDAKNYPLTSPTREKLKGPFKQEVATAIQTHLVKAAKDKSKADIKAAFDALIPQKDAAGRQLGFVTNDRGGRYTKQELSNFNSDPSVQGIAHYIGNMLNELNRLFPNEQVTKTIKYGFDIADNGKGGINIQDVDNHAENAILIGFFDALNESNGNPKTAGEMIAHTVLHEFNHNRERNEGAGFTYALRDTDSKYGTDRRGAYAKAIEALITDGRGKFNSRILKLIQEHTAARGRPDTTIDFIARQEQGGFLARSRQDSVSQNSDTSGTGVASISNPWPKVQAATGIGSGGANTMAAGQMNWIKEALAVPAGMTTTMDLSAPFRQGLSQIHTPQFWKAIAPMLKAGWSEQIFNTIDADLRSKRVMQPRRNRVTGKVRPSIAQEAGLKMFESASHGNMSQRAQATASRWLEQGIGKTTTHPTTGATTWQSTRGSRAWAATVGRPIRASNRAYITFLNHLKVNRFEHLMRQGLKMSVQADLTGQARPGIFKQNYTQQEAADLDPYRNKMLAKEIADFVNTATGQGPLKTHILPTKHAEVSLEAAAGALQHIFFSPGLIASRMRMLNPNTYVMASPMVRRQYMMAALATGTAWMSSLAMMKLGGGDEVEVNIDNPTSADWMKAKIGDTRMDPGGGFQQFLVSMARMIEGGTTSSASGEWREFGEGFMAQTQKSNLERFMSNKLNPVTKFAYDLASQSEYNPFHVYDRTAQLFVPLVIQDLVGLYYEDPSMLPWMGPIMLGMGTQTYGRGESVGKLVAPENDWLASGGGFADLGKSEDADTY